MASVTARNVIQMLHELFDREGAPRSLVSDNGVQFTSHEFTTFLKEYGVEHVRKPNYHPIANGMVERFNRTLGSLLAAAKAQGGDLRSRLVEMMGAYNSSPHATTGISPH